MKKSLKVYQVDSFTRKKFKGNPAGVILHADSLTENEMLLIARELNNSETAFIFSPEGFDHDIRIRYFTPTVEVPICGHATIAAHYVRAIEKELPSCTVYQKTAIGVLPVEIIKEHDDYSIMMTQGLINFQEPFVLNQSREIIKALGLEETDLIKECPIQIVSTGHSKVLIGIKSRDQLNNLSPDFSKLKELSNKIKCNGYFVFTLNSDINEIFAHGRMFAPAIGINEDPVTGNANGPLGAYLVKHKLINYSGEVVSFKSEQGYAIGRSGIVNVTVEILKGKPQKVKVRGDAVIVFKGECTIEN